MADLHVEEREGFGLATIMARRNVDGGAISNALGVEAPSSPQIRTNGDGLALIGTGPRTWLAYAETGAPFWADALRHRLRGLASVSDQSSGYTVLRLSGADARTVLQRGMAIDLHPDQFGPGAAATTVIAHIGAIVWRRDDRPSYEVATFRSYAESFRHWFDQTAAAL